VAVSVTGGGVGVITENQRLVTSQWQTLSHNVCCIEHTSPWAGFELTTFVETDSTDCTGSCKCNYYTITTM